MSLILLLYPAIPALERAHLSCSGKANIPSRLGKLLGGLVSSAVWDTLSPTRRGKLKEISFIFYFYFSTIYILKFQI